MTSPIERARFVPRARGWLTGYFFAVGASGLGALFATGMPVRGAIDAVAAWMGFAAFYVFCLQFILTARFLPLGRSVGVDAELRFHGKAGMAGAALVALHAVLLIASAPGNAGYLDPRLGPPGGWILHAALFGLGALALLSLGRRRIGLPYDLWRVTHGVLAAGVIAAGAGHMVTVGYYSSGALGRALVLVPAGLALTALVHIRLVKPLWALRRPWVVAEVRYEAPKVWTLAVQALNHGGMRFRPGQYAWLTLGNNPFRLEQHPFTIASSSERRDRLEFVIKELGDFTSTMASVSPDTTAYVEGPYGGMDAPEEDGGTVFIAGGVGLTPALSMLRTRRDRKDPRPFHLIYAASSEARLVFRAELERLKEEIPLTTTYVLEAPPAGWTGESGFLTREMLDRRLPREKRHDWNYRICGPEPMIELAHRLLTELGVPRRRQRSERFNWI